MSCCPEIELEYSKTDWFYESGTILRAFLSISIFLVLRNRMMNLKKKPEKLLVIFFNSSITFGLADSFKESSTQEQVFWHALAACLPFNGLTGVPSTKSSVIGGVFAALGVPVKIDSRVMERRLVSAAFSFLVRFFSITFCFLLVAATGSLALVNRTAAINISNAQSICISVGFVIERAFFGKVGERPLEGWDEAAMEWGGLFQSDDVRFHWFPV